MTFEEVLIQKTSERAQCTGQALEEVLLSAKANDYLTIGVYESAKIMNVWVCCPFPSFMFTFLIKHFDWFTRYVNNLPSLVFQWPGQCVFLRPGNGWGFWVWHRSPNPFHSHPSFLFWQRHQHRQSEWHAASCWDCWWQAWAIWGCSLCAHHGMYRSKYFTLFGKCRNYMCAFATFWCHAKLHFIIITTEPSWGLLGGPSSWEASPVLWRKSQL